MRFLFVFLTVSLYGSACFAQSDSSKTTQAPVQRDVAIPGIDTPISGGGMATQMPINAPMPTREDGKRRKTQPPSNPRSFGVSIPLEKDKAKRDTLKN